MLRVCKLLPWITEISHGQNEINYNAFHRVSHWIVIPILSWVIGNEYDIKSLGKSHYEDKINDTEPE